MMGRKLVPGLVIALAIAAGAAAAAGRQEGRSLKFRERTVAGTATDLMIRAPPPTRRLKRANRRPVGGTRAGAAWGQGVHGGGVAGDRATGLAGSELARDGRAGRGCGR